MTVIFGCRAGLQPSLKETGVRRFCLQGKVFKFKMYTAILETYYHYLSPISSQEIGVRRFCLRRGLAIVVFVAEQANVLVSVGGRSDGGFPHHPVKEGARRDL